MLIIETVPIPADLVFSLLITVALLVVLILIVIEVRDFVFAALVVQILIHKEKISNLQIPFAYMCIYSNSGVRMLIAIWRGL